MHPTDLSTDKRDFSPTSPNSSSHHQSMSTDSTSPIIPSTSSLASPDNRGLDIRASSFPVNEHDEIIHRNYFCAPDPEFDDCERNVSLWQDLDRDGVNTPAIPSFILNSPPLGPLTGGGIGVEYEDMMLRVEHAGHTDVASHSLRKGYDPKFFFGDTAVAEGMGNLNVDTTSFISEKERDHVEPIGTRYSARGYRSSSPSPSTATPPVNDNSLWGTSDVDAFKYIPSQGPWGIIPSRSIMISNLPKTTQLWTLVELLKGLGDRTGIFTEMIASYGSAIVSFHDLRDAYRCLRHIRTDNFFATRRLDTHFVSILSLLEMASQGYNIPFLDMTSGKVCVSGNEGELDPRLMRTMLESFGDIYSLDTAERERGKVILCEYYDRRRSIDVVETMNGRDLFGVRLNVWSDVPHPLMHLRIHRPFMSMEQRPYHRLHPSVSTYRGIGQYLPLDTRDPWPTKSPLPSNLKLFPSADAESSSSRHLDRPFQYPPNIGRAYYEGVGIYESFPSTPRASSSATQTWSDNDLENYFTQIRLSPDVCTRDITSVRAKDVDAIRPTPTRANDRESPVSGSSPGETDESISGESLGTSSGNTLNSVNGSVLGSNVPEKNKVVLEKIRMGLDTRTTIMIKNVPNKYTQQMLMEYVDITNAGTYDFLYLRIDFQNRCNVGYAFINFIDPTSIIPFANARVGTKWNRFHSDKICDISYANIQGKESLIEKFRNSCVMDEDPTYRPKIFHSSGPLKGQEQEFLLSPSEPPPAPHHTATTRVWSWCV